MDLRRQRNPSDEITTLSPAESRIAEHLPDGLSDKQISETIGMNLHTLKVHLKNINRKLGTRNRTQVAILIDRQRSGRSE